jgi:hypothetical protein
LLKILALACIIPSGALFVKYLLGYKRACVGMLEELVNFFLFLEEGIRSRLAPTSDLIEEYNCSDELKVILRHPGKIGSSRVSCIIYPTDLKTIVSVLESGGEMGYTRLADMAQSAREGLESALASEKEKLSREEKIYPLIASAIAAGLFILVI